MLLVARDGHIALANAQVSRVFGYEPGELLGQPVELLVPDALRGQHQRERAEFAARPAARRMGTGAQLFGRHRDGHLIVSDSHYHCFRIYDAEGKELRHFGGEDGTRPGQFGYVSDVVQDRDGNYYVSEYKSNERITKLDAAGKVLACWGEPGTEPGQFSHIRALALGPDGLLLNGGYSGHGIMAGAGGSRRVVELLTGALDPSDNAFRPDRPMDDREHDIL